MENYERLELARNSLTGLSIGDAFGERFFGPEEWALKNIKGRHLPNPPWTITDDSIMGAAIYACLRDCDTIDQELLAKYFASNYAKEPNRGYGGTAHSILSEIGHRYWKRVSSRAFDGMGSMGNGSAMRVAPIGAYFYDDIDLVIENAKKSAEITHFNEEAKDGAVAIAVCAAMAQRYSEKSISKEFILEEILRAMSDTDMKYKVAKVGSIGFDCHFQMAVSTLGNGVNILCHDTVPFCLWVALNHLDSYEEALWTTVMALGDRDTTCAIVGGIVSLSSGIESIPQNWIDCVEPWTKFSSF